jgi:hypothetical protein
MFKAEATGLFTGETYPEFYRNVDDAKGMYDAYVRQMNAWDIFSTVTLSMWVEGIGTWHTMESARPEWARGMEDISLTPA